MIDLIKRRRKRRSFFLLHIDICWLVNIYAACDPFRVNICQFTTKTRPKLDLLCFFFESERPPFVY